MVRAFDAGLRIRRILFATDFSSSARAALPYAVRLARFSQAQLYVAHVVKALPWEIRPELSMRRRISATSRLDETLGSAQCDRILLRPVVRHGAVVAQLLQIAFDYAVDLVVTGTRSHQGLGYMLRGSTAEELAQSAPCPVLAVGPSARPASDKSSGFRNIVLATRLNPGAATAIAYACSFARQHGAKLSVAHALRLGSENPARECADTWLKKVVPDSPGVVRVLETGSVEQVTVALAERESADLVMLAPGLGELLQPIVRHVACPVMTVRYAIPMVRPKTARTRSVISS
jgi:nucleotide-binding universal stress UspA family protein